MFEENISVIDFARQNGYIKQTVFKVMKRLAIEPQLRRGASDSRGQAVAYITQQQAELILDDLKAGRRPVDRIDASSAEAGVFYVIRLEPEHDPKRFKVGFATNLAERLRHLRTSAPLLIVEKTWPCKKLWEKTAIDCVTQGCEQVHTEVFRTDSLELILTRCEQFFAQMPSAR
jgi:hypothetical protein